MNQAIQAEVISVEEKKLVLKTKRDTITCTLAEDERPLEVGEKYELFLWQHHNKNWIASRRLMDQKIPYFDILEVVGFHPKGYLVEWDRKPNLLAKAETDLDIDKDYIFYITTDDEDSLVAYGDYRDHFQAHTSELKEGQEVDILIYSETELGVKCIVNNKYEGLIYHDQIYGDFYRGERRKAFVQHIREDGKLDIILYQNRKETRDDNAQVILDFLEENEGEMDYTDKSCPTEIAENFGMSKKAFKRALGSLYKEKLITLEPTKTKLNHGKRH
ncbi:MAG: hypothetical protein N4A45_02875 [Flavobacteriales bacterium]|jgi:predicted RNA-binding protein (virulence factor B family)|nr:hypothetical protein [Flavobacteriales bacterium]